MSDLIEPPTLNILASLKRPIQWSLIAGFLAVMLSLFFPNYYKSEAYLLPIESKGPSALGGLASAAAAFGVNVPGSDGGDANFVDVLSSRLLKERLLQTEFEYHLRSWRFGSERAEKGTLFAYLNQKNMDRAIRELGSVLFISRDMKSKIIVLSAETKSPELSQLIVQRAIKLLEAFLQEKGRTRGGAKVAFTEARLAEARREMDEAEDAFRSFLRVNRSIQTSADPDLRLKNNRLETELRLRQQLVTTLAMNREQALLEEKNDVPILNVLDPGNLPIEKSRPSLSLNVLSWMAFVGIGTWIWFNRGWVFAKRPAVDSDEPRHLVGS